VTATGLLSLDICVDHIWRRGRLEEHPGKTDFSSGLVLFRDVQCTITKAEAVFLIVLNGSDGSGFSVQAESGLNELLPAILRRVAQEISGQDQITDS
jgi:hypothetical protein